MENNINFIFISVEDMNLDKMQIDKDKRFFYEGKEIGLIIYRNLYNPDHFDKNSIEFYAKTESSKTINVPDIYQVITSMKTIMHLLFNKKLK